MGTTAEGRGSGAWGANGSLRHRVVPLLQRFLELVGESLTRIKGHP